MERNNHIEITDDLLVAYLLNEANAMDRIAVERWMAQSSENQKYFDDLSKTWDFTNDVSDGLSVNTEEAWTKVKAQLTLPVEKTIQLAPKSTTRRLFFVAAAAIAVIVGSVTLLKYMSSSTEELTLTAKTEMESIQLNDGSDVELSKGAKLTYPSQFGDGERNVKLEGNAFFKIVRNVEKPFVIDLPRQLHVKVLGTSFTIQTTTANNTSEVKVKTGKVEFGSENEVVILTVGEIGRMEHATGKISKISAEEVLQNERIQKRKKLSFDKLELSRVVEVLNELFEDSVQLDCPELSSALIVSTHENESLPKILNVIAEVHGLRVIKSDQESIYVLRCD